MGDKVLERRVFHLPNQDHDQSKFKMKYDEVQSQLRTIAGMDDLLSGKHHVSYISIQNLTNTLLHPIKCP